MKKRFWIGGLIIVMLLQLFGCKKEDNRSPEDVAKEALKSKYGCEFTVVELSKAGSTGGYLAKEYTGRAYENSQPDLLFDIRISKEKELVSDAYEYVKQVEKYDDWATEKAQRIWTDSKVHMNFRFLEKVSRTDYATVEEFFASEKFQVEMTLCISEKPDSAQMKENLKMFFSEIGTDVRGTLNIYILDTSTLSSEALYKVKSDNDPCWFLSVNADTGILDTIFR